MALTIGTKGMDSGRHLDPKDAHDNHKVRFQMRYSAGVGNTNEASAWKLCGENEIHQILEAGSEFGANSEWYEGRCTEGKSAGKEDGEADLHFWKSRGYDKGCSIAISWDADPSRIHYLAVKDYLEGYRKGLDGFYEADGMYAGLGALLWLSEHAGIRHGWIPSAASWSGSNREIDRQMAPPAKSFWDLWQPSDSQVDPALEHFGHLTRHSKLDTLVWQCGNYLYDKSADVNYVVKSGNFGFMAPKSQAKPLSKPEPTPSHHPRPGPLKTPVKSEPAPVHHEEEKTYTVRHGDTLVSIAKEHNTTWKKIFKANLGHVKNPNVIHPGDKIKLP